MRRVLFSLLLIIGILVGGCVSVERVQYSGYMVKDGLGDEVHIKSKPQRIYAATVNLEETVLNLVGAERMAVVSEDITKENIGLLVDEARKVQKRVPQGLSPEQILALHPDLVIIQERDRTTTQHLRELGLTVFVLPVPKTVEDVENRIVLLGQAVKEEARSQNIVAEMDALIKRIDERMQHIPQEQRKVAIAYSALGAFGTKGGIFHEICTRAGLINGAALAGLERGDHLGKEAIVKVNPDLFIFPTEFYITDSEEKTEKLREEISQDPSFATVTAVKDQNYIFVHDRYRYATSHDIVKAIKILHEAVYGPLN